ncbi:MAG: orotate phosphoribosyltransferase [Spirochaetales bacterium]|nr:orotate phosphoribosyltransferase [Spirochaetales bacterium]
MKNLKTITRTHGQKIARAAFELGAIRLDVTNPFRWVSGYRMPIYNDNRRLLASSEARRLVAEGFEAILNALEYDPDSIAGTATAGIPHATTLADRLEKPLSYVRSASKGHGLGNRIEGLAKGGTYENAHVLLIEDLISTGLSSTGAVEAIVAAKGKCPYTLAIFTYGFAAAEEAFAALRPEAEFHAILTYEVMLESALKEGYISHAEAKSLEAWRADPFGWGIERGFMKEEG